jgi:hypothetical protein
VQHAHSRRERDTACIAAQHARTATRHRDTATTASSAEDTDCPPLTSWASLLNRERHGESGGIRLDAAWLTRGCWCLFFNTTGHSGTHCERHADLPGGHGGCLGPRPRHGCHSRDGEGELPVRRCRRPCFVAWRCLCAGTVAAWREGALCRRCAARRGCVLRGAVGFDGDDACVVAGGLYVAALHCT